MQQELPPGLSNRARALGPELTREIEDRAHALWVADGRPEGRALDYWLQAEREIINQSVAGEEDPFVAVDRETAPG